MQKFLAKMDISQVVFALLAVVLAFQTIYLTIKGGETKLFDSVLLVIIGYYYGKSTADKRSSNTLVEGDLDDNFKL